jgi:predicted metal-dependent hydrolase
MRHFSLMRFLLPSLKASASDPTHFDVEHQGVALRIAVVRRQSARRMTLRVSHVTKQAVLTVPERGSIKAARAFADSYAGWIISRLAAIPEKTLFKPDALIPLRGVPHRIVAGQSLRGLCRVDQDDQGLPIIWVAGGEAHIARRIRAFLMREAKRDLTEAVARHCRQAGLVAKSIALRDTRSRWGSCSAKGALNFSWRMILAPPFVLDYLAAHEVAHLREMNHSPRFWKLVHQLCPRTLEAENWLKREGSKLHHYG